MERRELNYIQAFKGTVMYDNMIDRSHIKGVAPKGIDPENLMSLDEKEDLKKLADKMTMAGFPDGGQVMVDISHRQRYLGANSDRPLDFFAYVEWKYTNPDCLTY